MNKIKKLLFIASLMVSGIAANSYAVESGWFTFRSTGICIATGTNLELLDISYSSGSFNWGDAFFVLVDSNAHNSQGAGSNFVNHNFSEALFPVSQYAIPPVLLFQSSVTFSTTGYSAVESRTTNKINFVDPDGDGLLFKNGINLFQVGSTGTIYKIRYRKKR